MKASSSYVAKRIIVFCIFIAVVLVVDIVGLQWNTEFQSYAWRLITGVLEAGYLLLAWYLNHFFAGN